MMDIQINLGEKELRELIRNSIENYIDRAVASVANEAYNIRGFDIMTEKVTTAMVDYMPKYLEENKPLIIDRAAQRLIQAFKIKNADIVKALIELSEDVGNE